MKAVIFIARIEFKMPDDFLSAISKLEERTDDIIPKVLEAGGEVVLKQVRSNLQAVIGRGIKDSPRSSGELVSALGLSPAKMDAKGDFNIKVGFDESRPDGSSNAIVANTIEYGKHGQPPKPFLKPAKSASRAPAIDAMKKKLEDEVGNI